MPAGPLGVPAAPRVSLAHKASGHQCTVFLQNSSSVSKTTKCCFIEGSVLWVHDRGLCSGMSRSHKTCRERHATCPTGRRGCDSLPSQVCAEGWAPGDRERLESASWVPGCPSLRPWAGGGGEARVHPTGGSAGMSCEAWWMSPLGALWGPHWGPHWGHLSTYISSPTSECLRG